MQNMQESTEKNDDLSGQTAIAKVIDNVDPSGQARVRITVAGIPSISQAPGVWAAPDTVSGGGGGGDATQDIPSIGSEVYVEFQDGDIHFPLYKGAVIGPSVLGVMTHGNNGDPAVYGWRRGVVEFTAHKGSGEIYLTCPAFKVHIDGSGAATIEGNGPALFKFPQATFEVPDTTFTGNVDIQGNVNIQKNLVTTGQTTANGGFTAANGQPCTLPVTTTIGGIQVYTHSHGGVQRGGAATDPMGS